MPVIDALLPATLGVALDLWAALPVNPQSSLAYATKVLGDGGRLHHPSAHSNLGPVGGVGRQCSGREFTRKFTAIPSKYPTSHFLHQPPSNEPVDGVKGASPYRSSSCSVFVFVSV